MKAEFINPFLSKTRELFSTTFDLEVQVHKPYLLKSVNSTLWEISAEMFYSGDYEGAFAIRMSKLLSQKLLKATDIIYKNEYERVELLAEMVKELANIIGSAVTEENFSKDIKVSVPIIIQGKEEPLIWPPNITTVCIPFATQFGPFIEIFCLKY